MTDLMPCPFCGCSGDALEITPPRGGPNGGDPTEPVEHHIEPGFVMCLDCYTMGPLANDPEQVVNAWNARRTPEGTEHWSRVTIAEAPDGALSLSAEFHPSISAKSWDESSDAVKVGALLLQHAKDLLSENPA